MTGWGGLCCGYGFAPRLPCSRTRSYFVVPIEAFGNDFADNTLPNPWPNPFEVNIKSGSPYSVDKNSAII